MCDCVLGEGGGREGWREGGTEGGRDALRNLGEVEFNKTQKGEANI